jgi:gliding motility-associated-like protein
MPTPLLKLIPGFLFFVILLVFNNPLFAQQPAISRKIVLPAGQSGKDPVTEAISRSGDNSTHHRFSSHPNLLSAVPYAKQQLIQHHGNKVQAARNAGSIKNLMASSSEQSVCYAISGRNFLFQDSIFLYTGDPSLTADGNVIVSGEYSDYSIQPLVSAGGFCMKTDLQGNIIWAKLFDSTVHKKFGYINYIKSLELSDGSILLAGRTSNDIYVSADFILTKLDKNGKLIWTKTYQSRLWQGFNGSGDHFALNDLKEDTSTGDIYFVGSHWFSSVAVTKVNTNNGAIIWSNAYDTFNSEYGFGIVINAGDLLVFQLSVGSTNANTINVTSVNKVNGDSIFTRFYQYSGGPNEPLMYKTFEVKHLNNGHYMLSGATTQFSEFSGFTGTKDLYHAEIIEFDENLNFVKAFGFKNRIESNGYNTKVTIYPDGSGVFTMLDFISSFTGESEICLFKGDQIYHQRRRLHSNEGIPHEPYSLPLSNGGSLMIKLMGDSTKAATDGSRLDYYRIHPSDTPSTCLGILSTSTSTWHRTYKPYQGRIDSVKKNIFRESTVKTLDTWEFTAAPAPACTVVSNCDTLSLTTSETSVCSGTVITLTATKNSACGSLIPLSFDSSKVRLVARLTDSTYSFQMTTPGNIDISASLRGCTQLNDTVFVQVLPAINAVNLGKDSVICPGNNIKLNAGYGFASYVWQDGLTDSIYTVTQPGTYSVTAVNGCGVTFRDTIIVSAHAPIPFNIGMDRTKCNGDTLHLSAPAGFLNYTWSNNYNISSLTAQAVVVNPMIDTSYYVKAEKSPGCFAYDTVNIRVLRSPAINLGANRSFCLGDSAVLDAGPGFQSYLWSSGQITEKVTVKASGIYWVYATTSDGCSSRDTVEILNPFTLPVVKLDKNNALCFGQSKTLTAGVFASYNWNTGATTQAINVTDIGTYSVIVTDQNGCKGKDSSTIQKINPLPAKFLSADTAICEYESLLLKPLNPYNTYAWSNGENKQSITVKKPGIYWLEVTDINACIGRDTIVVSPKKCMAGFFAPTAFTPNGDNLNDSYAPLLFGNVVSYRFTIFNRWGEIVFQTSEARKGWDGTFKGRQEPSSVFSWICTYQFEGEKPKTEKGTAALIR